MTDARAKLYINTGVVTDKSDIYNILRPLLKQTVTYTYRRGAQVTGSGTGWVERIVVDHPEIASYFTPLAICLNLDSFDYLQFDTTSDQLLVYTLVIGEERVVLEFATAAPRADVADDARRGARAPAHRGRAGARPALHPDGAAHVARGERRRRGGLRWRPAWPPDASARGRASPTSAACCRTACGW